MRVRKVQKSFVLGVLLVSAAAVGCGRLANDDDDADKATETIDDPRAMSARINGIPEGDKPVTSDTLSLEFAIDSDLAALGLVVDRFECRIGSSKEYTVCTGAPFVISGLRHSEEYSLAVRAVIRNPATGDVYTTEET